MERGHGQVDLIGPFNGMLCAGSCISSSDGEEGKDFFFVVSQVTSIL